VDVDGVLQPGDNQEFLQQIRHYLINELNLHVASTCIHPLGVGLIELESARHRDGLMLGKLHEVDGIRVRFIRHDYGLNRRSEPYTRFGWIMILGFPLDYRALNFIDQAVAPFGKLISWHNNPRAKGYVLVKCLYNDIDLVPRSLFFRQGDRNGSSWGWGVPVYVLNWDHLDELFPPVGDLPQDGNPHPLPPPPPLLL
jgi:hypothetical protein